MKNEAILEARINNILSHTFPAFKDIEIVHQKSFTIKFGHHNILINGREPKNNHARAVLDVLLKINDENIILLELKKEGHKFTDDDKLQGLSYGRLLHPMPPITLFSNGKDHMLFDTYTQKEIDCKDDKDLNFFKNLIGKNLSLSVSERGEVLKQLLNKENILFSTIINHLSQEKFNSLIGEIDDFKSPIANNFLVEREILEEINDLFTAGDKLIGVIGSSFSGKTSILYQFFEKNKSEDNFFFYLDCLDDNYSIFRELSNVFSTNLGLFINDDKVREWILLSLSINTQAKFYLLIDNFNNDVSDVIKNEITELIDVFSNSGSCILYTIDDYNYSEVSYHKTRNYLKSIGKKSKILNLKSFSEEEFKLVEEECINKFRIYLQKGSVRTLQYREPRILRYLISLSLPNCKSNSYFPIDSILNLNYFEDIIKNGHYNSSINIFYKKLSKCYLKDSKNRSTVSKLKLISASTGAITEEVFIENYPNDLDPILKSSTVVRRLIEDDLYILIPKLPELLAYHISEIIIKEIKENKTINTNDFLNDIDVLPFNDLVGARVINTLIKDNFESNLILGFLGDLIQLCPRIENVGNNTIISMLIEDVDTLDLITKKEYGELIDNFLPYLILSQSLIYPFCINNNGNYDLKFYFEMMKLVASSEISCHSVHYGSLNDLIPISIVSFGKDIQLIDISEGIVEPIVYCLSENIIKFPNEIKLILDEAISEDNFCFVWRLNIAATALLNVDSDVILLDATDVFEKCNKYLSSKC